MNFSKLKTLLIITLLCSITLSAQDKPELKIGGALRFNYNLSSWKEGQVERGGDFGYDVFSINILSRYKGLTLDADYRFYHESLGGRMLKHGWIGYDFDNKNNIQVGLTQVPFGITPSNSNSWFYNMNYFVGLEQDYDMGVKYSYTGKNFDYALAFFKNAEEFKFGSYSDMSDSRYGYDIASIDINHKKVYRNKEVNQINGKINYKIGNDKFINKIGLSGEYGGIYNLDTKEVGNHHAFALHYQLESEKISVKLQYSKYGNKAQNPQGQSNEKIAMTSYGAPYLVAANGAVYTLTGAYKYKIDKGIIDFLQFYNDFGALQKDNKEFNTSFMNVSGVLVQTGNISTYIEYAIGKNHPYFGNNWLNALTVGTPDAKWNSRLNINIGYYF